MDGCVKILVVAIFYLLAKPTIAKGVSGQHVTNVLSSLSKDYDKNVRPNYGGSGVTVGVTAYILSMDSLSEENMDFSIDMYFRQFWFDPRLAFKRKDKLNKIVLSHGYDDQFWEPDTFFVNAKEVAVQKEPNKNTFIRIMSSGDVLLSKRIRGKFSCPMNLQYFPMDSQLCYIEIESFGFTMNDIRYKWNDGLNSIQISSDVSLPQFKVLGHRQKTIEASLSTGNYSRLAMEIQLVRSSGYYMFDSYIPSIFLVLASFVSCMVNSKYVGLKIGIPMACLLGMLFLMRSINQGLPKISYFKAIDVHSLACTIQILFVTLGNVLMVFLEKDTSKEYSPIEKKSTRRPCGLTLVALSMVVAFPAVLVIFEIVYWSYYLGMSTDVVDDLVYLS